jgi:hypothetical protein
MSILARFPIRSNILAIVAGCTFGLCLGQSQDADVQNLCTVAANIHVFNGHYIELAGFLGVGKEQAVFYDPKCQNGKPLMYVEFKRNAEGETKGLRRILQKNHYAAVIVEGTVLGGAPVKVAPHLPDWLKDLKDSPERFSHLNPFDMMIEIDRVVSAKDVNDGLKPNGR